MGKLCFQPETKTKYRRFLLLNYLYILARHRLNIGANEQFKVEFTHENNKPMYTQGPPTPVHYQDEILVELILLQNLGSYYNFALLEIF